MCWTPKIFTGISSVQFSCSVMSNSLWPHGLQHARPPRPSLTPGVYSNSCPLSDAIQPFHPLSPPSPPAFSFPQHQGLFQWASSSHQVAKGLEFQHQHQSFQWTFRLISFRMDWLDLLAVQGTLKTLVQHYSSKASILLCSAFFFFFAPSVHLLAPVQFPWGLSVFRLLGGDMLSFLYSPTLTSIHDYWKNYSID